MNATQRLLARARRLLLWTLALAVVGELALRLFDLACDHPTGSLYDAIVPTGERFKLTPHGRLIAPERYGDIEYRFNRQGYRDRDHDPAGDARRLVILGDSVSFGLGVRQDEIYPSRLEALLATRQGPNWEVLNLAVFAYDSRDELLALREDGLAWRPRVVVVQFYMNDLALRPPMSTVSKLPLWDRLLGLRNQWIYRSNLYRRVQQGLKAAAFAVFHDWRRRERPETLNRAEPIHKQAYLASRPEDAEVETFTYLAQIAAVAREHGARLLLVHSPDESQLFDTRYDDIQARVAAFCARQGIALLDLLPALRRHSDRNRVFLDGVHFSPRGHEIVAGLVADELARRGFLATGTP